MLDAERVRMTRLKYRISQRVLAEKIGQHQSYISRLERGDVIDITARTLEALADALNVTTDYLLGRDQKAGGEVTSEPKNRHQDRNRRILEEDDEKQLMAAAAL